MKDYEMGRYLYPPRPETKAPVESLSMYERLGYIAQPKLNGSCGVLFLGGNPKLMGRHNDSFARQLIDPSKFSFLSNRSGVSVVVGEYMNKSKRDCQNRLFNSTFVIFDILVSNGKYLLRSTFEERQELLDTLYGTGSHYDSYISQLSDSIYRANNFTQGFTSTFLNMTKGDMYEGFVMKRPDGKLDTGYSSKNNTGWQVKVRKPTKLYKY
jgi:hypothetical protein